MLHRRLVLTLMLGLATGCVSGDSRLLAQKDIVNPSEQDRNSVLDVKIEKYEKLAAAYPKEPKHRERLAAFYWQREDYQRAIYNLDRARELDPKNSKYDHFEGRIHQDNGNYDLALACYQRVLNSMDKDMYSGPHYDIAWLYLELKRVPEAVAELERCLEIDPVDPTPHYLLGKIEFEQRGNKEAAIRHFETYLELKGTIYHEEVRNILINLQPDLGRTRYNPES
ncbi:MAG: tetratricopeptide repeat protein [Planctomycetota bacterium]